MLTLLLLKVCLVAVLEVPHYEALSRKQHQQLEGKLKMPTVNQAMLNGKQEKTQTVQQQEIEQMLQ
jgi:hypothetical protein